ncbi:hypothetical protein [Janthinobacterium sp. PC23-8]|uniref:hypothetical protein n=1 Tax=Janthinobacterium sp. PC23-8 TaxID=2012679 RepID=UPI00159583BA|nr:hypothetical protein [Janthinobacterium sp. PC23-8]
MLQHLGHHAVLVRFHRNDVPSELGGCGEQAGVAHGCWRRRQIDPGCRFQLTQLKISGTVAARGFAGYGRGLPKIGSLGQKIVGANNM